MQNISRPKLQRVCIPIQYIVPVKMELLKIVDLNVIRKVWDDKAVELTAGIVPVPKDHLLEKMCICVDFN